MARLNQQHKIIDTLAIGTLAAMGGLLIGNGQSVAASTDVVATTVTQSAVSTPVATDENATASQDSNNSTTGELATGSESATEVSEPGETDHSSAATTAENGVPATEPTTADQDTQTSTTTDEPAETSSTTSDSEVVTAPSSAETPTSQATTTAQQDTDSTITLPAGFDSTLFADVDSADQLAAEHDHIATVTAAGLQDPTNVYHAATDDESVKITSATQITPEINLILSDYTANLLNQVRAQLDAAPLTVSRGAVDFAQAVSAAYEQDQWQIRQHGDHDVAAISAAAAEYGLKTGSNYYENISAGYVDFSNLSTLKQGIYETILDMLFADGDLNFGHTLSLIGYGSSTSSAAEYVGVAVDAMGQIHILLVPTNKIEVADRFSTQSVTIPTTAQILASDPQPNPAVTVGQPTQSVSLKKDISTPVSLNTTTDQKSQTEKVTVQKLRVHSAAHHDSASQTASTLPQTDEGSSQTLWTSLLGTILVAMAALFGSKRREN